MWAGVVVAAFGISEPPRRYRDHGGALSLLGDRAKAVLRKNQADLIVVGREILNNPNWLMDKALKFGGRGLLTRP